MTDLTPGQIADLLEPGARIVSRLGRKGTFARFGDMPGCVYVTWDDCPLIGPAAFALRNITEVTAVAGEGGT
jgi:hypothetical protein